MNIDDMQQSANAAAELLKTLANPSRLMVLCNILKQECTVGELEKLVGISQSALSQHLSRLRHEGIVSCRREGQNAYYSLQDERSRHVIEALYGIFCKPDSMCLDQVDHSEIDTK
ncbi:MAG: metalloregulator ArsR/SmtB family transcription factor [Nitrosomonas sp.]|nr:metalloregulator ArsR/SmtB family transcription factor [Nitrosomonas sp.]